MSSSSSPEPTRRGLLRGAVGSLAQVALERGEYDGALELFEQCTLEFAEVISRDPGDGWSTRLAMVARYFVGWTHRELGRDPVLSPQERREHLALAVEHLEDSLVQFEDLRERGLLLPGDEPQSREVALEIEACRGLLSRE